MKQEFLLFLLPLISPRTIRRRIARLAARLLPAPPPEEKRASSTARGPYHALPADQCAICAQNAAYVPAAQRGHDDDEDEDDDDDEPPPFPLVTPYAASPCGHAYCYHCIAERMMRAAEDDDGDDEEGARGGWVCLRCTHRVESSARVAAPHDTPSAKQESDPREQSVTF
jgi:peroxin-2